VEAAVTIVGIATAPGAAGIGVIRLSGPAALSAAKAVAVGVPQAPEARRAYVTPLVERSGAALDEGLFLYFASPRSYTGEDVVELHAHGSPTLLQLLQAELLKDERVRLAEPGEFTRRAFVNGRMDLSKAEAVADLVSASSEAAVRVAAAQLRGALTERLAAIRGPLLALRADVEAVLAFPDEAEGAEAGLGARLLEVLGNARELLSTAARGALARRGARVALLGPVNAGKSTLFNALLGEERALVDEEPGTTRDVLEGKMELGQLAVTLTDTAGLREGPGRIEALGIERAVAAVRASDLAVLVTPPGASQAEVEEWRALAMPTPVLQVFSKADVWRREELEPGSLAVSARTGEGVETLRVALVSRLLGEGVVGAAQISSDRHRRLLEHAVESLERAAEAMKVSTLEIVAGELALAGEAVGQITGAEARGELLDEVFRRFCIGK
jgi:tRNA modification GTPase